MGMKKGSTSNFKGRHHSEDSLKKMSISLTGKKSPMKGKNHTNESKEKIRKSIKESLKSKVFDYVGEKNPAFGKTWILSDKIRDNRREKMIAYLITKPKNERPHLSKLEILLFDNYLKDLGFEYTGDWSLWINGKNPDFINKEKKLIVEYNSEWWHRNETNAQTQRRIDLFKSAGYDTLIIWEHELKNIDVLEQKLRNFC